MRYLVFLIIFSVYPWERIDIQDKQSLEILNSRRVENTADADAWIAMQMAKPRPWGHDSGSFNIIRTDITAEVQAEIDAVNTDKTEISQAKRL